MSSIYTRKEFDETRRSGGKVLPPDYRDSQFKNWKLFTDRGQFCIEAVKLSDAVQKSLTLCEELGMEFLEVKL